VVASHDIQASGWGIGHHQVKVEDMGTWVGARQGMVGGLVSEGFGRWGGREFTRRGRGEGGWRRGGGGKGRRVNLHGQGVLLGEGDPPPWQGGSALEDLRNLAMLAEASRLDADGFDLTIVGPAWKAKAPRGCSTGEGGQGCTPRTE